MVGDTGPEPTSLTPGNHKDLRNATQERGAESGAVLPDFGPLDADLRRVIEAWPDLPQSAKAGIVAMVKAASRDVGSGGSGKV